MNSTHGTWESRLIRCQKVHELWNQKRIFLFSLLLLFSNIEVWTQNYSDKVGMLWSPPSNIKLTKKRSHFFLFFSTIIYSHSTKGCMVTSISFAIYKWWIRKSQDTMKFGKLSPLYFIGSCNNYSKESHQKHRKNFIYIESEDACFDHLHKRQPWWSWHLLHPLRSNLWSCQGYRQTWESKCCFIFDLKNLSGRCCLVGLLVLLIT